MAASTQGGRFLGPLAVVLLSRWLLASVEVTLRSALSWTAFEDGLQWSPGRRVPGYRHHCEACASKLPAACPCSRAWRVLGRLAGASPADRNRYKSRRRRGDHRGPQPMPPRPAARPRCFPRLVDESLGWKWPPHPPLAMPARPLGLRRPVKSAPALVTCPRAAIHPGKTCCRADPLASGALGARRPWRRAAAGHTRSSLQAGGKGLKSLAPLPFNAAHPGLPASAKGALRARAMP